MSGTGSKGQNYIEEETEHLSICVLLCGPLPCSSTTMLSHSRFGHVDDNNLQQRKSEFQEFILEVI